MSSILKALLFFLLWTTAKGKDEEILCVYMKSCVLPCDFTPGSDLYIQWTQRDRGRTVHSFRQGQSQYFDQYHKYRGRTSLFEEEMNRGNASLLLRDVTLEDQGRFLCWANDQETYVSMKVFAPVLEVRVFSSGTNLICQSHDVYPEPSLNWTMNPEPSAEPQTSVNLSETGLFSVYSSVPLPDPPDEYTCTVSTEHSTKSKTYKRTTEPDPDPWLTHTFVFAVFLFVVAVFALYGIWRVLSMCYRKLRPVRQTEKKKKKKKKKSLGPNKSEEAETVMLQRLGKY